MKIIENNSGEVLIDEKRTDFDPAKFFLKLLKYWPYFLLSILIALGAAYLYNKTTPATYQVSSMFYVKKINSGSGILDLTGLSTGGGLNVQNDRLANEAIFLSSKPIAEKVLEMLDLRVEQYESRLFSDVELYNNPPLKLEVDWEHPQLTNGKMHISWEDNESYKIHFSDSEYKSYSAYSLEMPEIDLTEYPIKEFNFGEWLELPFLKIKITLNTIQPSGEALVKLRSKNELISYYTGENLIIAPIDATSSVLGLTLNTSNPVKGSDYLNTLMEVYLDEELSMENRIAKNTVDFIDSQITGVSDTLSFFESRLEQFRSNNRTYNIGEESNSVYREITELEKQLSEERFKIQYFQSLQNYLVRESYEQIIMPSGMGIDDPIMNSLIENLIFLQNEKSRLLTMQTEASPRVIELNRKIRDVTSSLSEIVRNMINNTELQIDDLEVRIGRINQQFSRLPSTEQNLLKIQREFTFNETIYNFLLQRRAEAAIALASNTNSNKIVEYSEPNFFPLKLKIFTIYILAMGFGIIFPMIIVGIISSVDKRIKDLSELEQELLVPLLGKINKNESGKDLAVFSEPHSPIAESYRALKTNISFVVPNDQQLTLAVSSTISGEGKTFSAINLASIYSLNEKKTILVSCDMFKRDISNEFKLNNELGLSNYLCKQVKEIDEIIQKSQFPFLDIISQGSIPPNPSELMAIPRFSSLLDNLKNNYDVIILDVPPVGLISQSFEILKLVDIILYLIRYNFSEKSFSSDLNNIKLQKGLPNIYAVLNDVPNKKLKYGGYQYHYYAKAKSRYSFFKNPFFRKRAAL